MSTPTPAPAVVILPGEVLLSVIAADEALRSHLLETRADGTEVLRVYPKVLPAKPKTPCLSYTVVSSPVEYTTEGPCRTVRPLVQVDVWGRTDEEEGVAAALVTEALSGFRGIAGEALVQGVFLEGQESLYDGEAKLFRRRQDWRLWFREA